MNDPRVIHIPPKADKPVWVNEAGGYCDPPRLPEAPPNRRVGSGRLDDLFVFAVMLTLILCGFALFAIVIFIRLAWELGGQLIGGS